MQGQYLSSGTLPESAFGIERAICRERRTVRVTFTAQPKAVSSSAVDDVLKVSNWTVIPRPDLLVPDGNLSYVDLAIKIIKVVRDDPYSVDVVMDDDFSFDIMYQITVSDSVVQADDIGTWTLPGLKTIVFAPYDPDCRQKPVQKVFSWFGRAAEKYDVTGDGKKTISIIQDLLEQMKVLIDCFPEQFNPLYCREDFLDSRMRSLGNPFALITSEMSLNDKRRVALQLIGIYRLKGTKTGIKTALENIIGVSPVEIISHNEITWRIGETHKQLEIPGVDEDETPRLGGGLFAPPPLGPTIYPDEPIDPNYIDNFQYTGTVFLGPTPEYTNAWIGSGEAVYDRGHIARLDGEWHLAGENDVPYLYDPATNFDGLQETATEEDIGVTVEKDRKGLYNYEIVLPTDFLMTATVFQRIVTIAQYMEPANMHLIKIRSLKEEYVPMILDVSLLDFDWLLHP